MFSTFPPLLQISKCSVINKWINLGGGVGSRESMQTSVSEMRMKKSLLNKIKVNMDWWLEGNADSSKAIDFLVSL